MFLLFSICLTCGVGMRTIFCCKLLEYDTTEWLQSQRDYFWNQVGTEIPGLLSQHSISHVHMSIDYHNPTWHSIQMSVRLMYLSVYDSRDNTSESGPSPFPPSSLTHVPRSIDYHNPTWHSMSTSTRVMYLSVYDQQRKFLRLHVPRPHWDSSLTHVHRSIGYHNPTWHSMSVSVRLMYSSVYDIRDNTSESSPSKSPPLFVTSFTCVPWQYHRLSQPNLT